MKLFVSALLLCASAISSMPVDGPGEFGDKFEGDILLPVNQRDALNSRTGLINTRYRWTKNIVPYIFVDQTKDQREAIREVLDEMEEDLCLTFVERTTEADYIRVTSSESGCFSNVGRIGGPQQLNLQSNKPGWGCFTEGIIMHEFIHALGFYHMQSAIERDNYVTIMWRNIVAGHRHNFVKYSANQISKSRGGYDYGSVMHYSPRAWSVNGRPTIVAKYPTAKMGQREGMSDEDVIMIRAMYCRRGRRVPRRLCLFRIWDCSIDL